MKDILDVGKSHGLSSLEQVGAGEHVSAGIDSCRYYSQGNVCELM